MVIMEREVDDVSNELSLETINEMEERRIESLNKAGIDEQEVLHNANKNLQTWNSYFNENIVRGKDDMNFCLRDQWTAVERSEFSRLFKPAMTFNKLYDSTKKVIGEQRKNKPDLIVRSLTGKATQEQINLRADLVRSIAYQSQTDLVYQTAFRSALMMGHGAFQVCLDYDKPKSFKKIISYDIIPDVTMCAWDATAKKPHKGDGNNCSRRFILPRDEFFATYPYVTNPVSYVDPNSMMDMQWVTRDTITICDEFVKEWFPLIIYKLSNGMTVTEEEWEEAQQTRQMQKKIVSGSIVERILEKEFPHVVDQRQTQDYKIMHYRMIRDLIIDFSEWPSRQLPIPFVDGDSYWMEGRQYTRSFIHEARDAQKCVNYFGSEIAAEIKNRRREQWLGTPDNIAGYEQDWRNPELQMGILRAKPDPKTGLMPQKMPAWELSQGLIANFQRASQDIREILGFSENEALQGRDISGKARRERKLEGSMSAYVFFDNLNQAIEQGGRIVNDLLPYIVGDDERSMVISKPDGKSQSITLNEKQKDGSVKNQIKDGEFDVEIDTGPSFAVQQDIALEFMQQTLQANPQAFNLIADLWASQLDVQMMPQIRERLKNLVPPQVLAKEEGKELPPPPPSPQEQMMQHEMQNKQQEIMERAKELEIRQKKHQLEEAELMLKAQKLKSDMSMDQQKNHIDMSKANLDFSAKIATILADVHKHHTSDKAV
jgi:hypothetical protein